MICDDVIKHIFCKDKMSLVTLFFEVIQISNDVISHIVTKNSMSENIVSLTPKNM